MKNSKVLLTMDSYPYAIYNAFSNNGFRTIRPLNSMAHGSEEYRRKEFMRYVECEKITHFFSYDFDIFFAELCKQVNIIYISWVFDSPHMTLHSIYSEYTTNRIFVFDYDEYIYLKNKGKKNIFHLPIGTDVDMIHPKAIQDNTNKMFDVDVSWMASLYSSNNLYDEINYLPDYLKGYIEGMMKVQSNLWGVDIFRNCLNESTWEELKKYIKMDLGEKYDNDIYKVFMDRIFGTKTAQLERKALCSKLAEKYDFCLFSGDSTEFDKRIVNGGYVNYSEEMPLLFHNSKININMTLHCISSGIPLRVMDILASEGFCLTNYQAEIAAYFTDGKELVIYEDEKDLFDKIDYYLEHENERKQIAHSGYKKVKEYFDYHVGIETICRNL